MNNLELRHLKKDLKAINALKDEYAKLSDSDLKNKTQEFRKRLNKGEKLDSLLPEAFAAIREADKRVLGLFPYDVQVLGGIALHRGYIAEMKTGEGKTLTATLPLYLNGLTKKGAMLVTTNNYLAYRDATEMGKVYRWMGLTIGVNAYDESKGKEPQYKPEEKRVIYGSDIIYTTNGGLGFDYLIDNLADSKDKKYMRDFYYAIVDEADEVLLDIAQTPLIISGAPRVKSNLYAMSDQFVTMLKKDQHYEYDEEENKAWITDEGWDFAEKFFRIENIFDNKHDELLRHLNLALRAHKTYEKDRDYVVQNDEINLLDDNNGRVLAGMKLQAGQHQAVEQKEHVELSDNTRSMATITYQSLFAKFEKLSGMTGTAKTVEDEMIESYHLKVVQIPTNKPVIRKDYPNKIYTSLAEKLGASLQHILKLHEKGQPVLIVTGSVEVSEIYSELLLQQGIAHNVLNAYSTVKEAAIIKEAGQKNAVTVATTLAGRGTDIKLGKGVAELGGLAVIGVELMPNRRIDMQIRGRAGRQGDPGFSQFYLSLEDKLIIRRGIETLHRYHRNHADKGDLRNPREIKNPYIKSLVKMAQSYNESSEQQARQQTVEYDESIKIQRDILYAQRDKLIYAKEDIDAMKIIEEGIDNHLATHKFTDKNDVLRYILDNFNYNYEGLPNNFELTNKNIKKILLEIASKELTRKQEILVNKHQMQDFIRVAILKAIDTQWVEEVDVLQQLKQAVISRAQAQWKPTYEYHKEAKKSFDRMRVNIKKSAIKYLLQSDVSWKKGKVEIYFA